MTQLAKIEEVGRLSQKLEQDLDKLDQDFTEKEGDVIINFYINTINDKINTAIINIPKWVFNVLPWESMEYLGDRIRKEVLENANLESTEKIWSQMSQAIDLLLEGKWDTPEYLSLLGQIVKTRNGLWAVLLMQNV